jgi:hypothetical protein
MGRRPTAPSGRDPVDIDTSAAHPARVRNFLAGGEANFTADRKAAEFAAGDMPGGMALARATVRSLGGFMVRAVQHLVSDEGVDQYLHIGTRPDEARPAPDDDVQHRWPVPVLAGVGRKP